MTVSKKDTWEKVVAKKAIEVVASSDLEPDSAGFLTPEVSPEQLIRKLSTARQWPDAVKVMTRSLPEREAVWWACVCARQMVNLAENENEMAALEAAEKWVFKPNDSNRRIAFETAEENSPPLAGTLTALGVGLSDGTIPAPENQFVEIDSRVFSQTLVAAVMLSVGEHKGEQLHDQFSLLLNRGEDIANGGNGLIGEGEK